MSLDPLAISLSQIGHVIAGLDRNISNSTSTSTSNRITAAAILDRLQYLHSSPAQSHVIRTLAHEALSSSSLSNSNNTTQSHSAALLASRPDLCRHPAGAASVRSALHRGPAPAVVSRTLRLSPLKEAALCLALDSCDSADTRTAASRLLKRRLIELVQNYLDRDAAGRVDGGLGDCTPELLQAILAGVDEDGLGLAPSAREHFLERLRSEFPRDVVPVVLAPLLYPDETETPLGEMAAAESVPGGALDGSLPELVREMGRSFTESVEDCRAALADAGGREISAAEVARTISAMARHPSNPPDPWLGGKKDSSSRGCDQWNPEIFARALRETQPNLNFKEVVRQLDHPEFLIEDRQSLTFLFAFLRCGLQSGPGYPNPFPVEHLYRHWNNVEGQLSLFAVILKNPDVFCFADHSHHPVAVDALKSQPESDGKEMANWRSLNLIELLVYFADRGFVNRVQEMFVVPMQHCPDVLLLALLQMNGKDTQFRHDLIGNLIPMFLGNHPNSLIVLHGAWHSQNPTVKTTVMQSMAGWYLRGENDQSRLSRILDVAQDLKCLSMLLNVQSFMFVLDLACLASRREYLKLDKWLTDKVREHGESFLSTMTKFLQRRCPIVNGKLMDDQLPKAAHLPQETMTTMLNVLHLWVNNVSLELSEAIITVSNNCSIFLNKRQSVPANLQRPHRMLESAPFNTSGIGAQMFTAPAVDPIAALNPNFANMTLNTPGNAFTLPNIAPLVSTPGSPSRLMTAGGPSNSPFTMMPISHNNLQNLGLVTRMNQPMDKRIPESQVIPEISQQVSKEIEEEANGYFQKIYNHPPHSTITIDEVLDMLKKFSESPVKREREIYTCMLRNLFEEYRFFPQYPDKELQITAQLFGGIIERGLVASYTALGLALKFVLDALRKPTGTKMYFFGIAALDRFKSRLKDYHKYCEHVKALEHFYEFPPHLIEYVEYGLQSQEPPNKPQGQIFPSNVQNLISPGPPAGNSSSLYKTPTAPTSSMNFNKIPANHPTSRPSIANATNIDTLLIATDKDEKMITPPDVLQEKCAFIFNNLSQLNLSTKCEELREIIIEEYWPWLSQYLVMKRASIELNFHTLYSNFLDVLKIKEFNEMVTRETFRNIKVLLRSDKIIENFSDRSLLKNLGHWLGMLTLGRNRPILQIDIDLKSLILEAYHKGLQELLYVVPFLAKVLESCDKSKVFKPRNPWTMSIMAVLAELHQEPDLKLNLKFEIEVLCKNLNIELEDIKPSNYLRDPERIHKIEYQLSHPGKKNATPIPISQNVTTPTPASLISVSNIIQQEEIAGPSVTPTNVMLPTDGGMVPLGTPMAKYSYVDVNVSSTSQIAHNISINPQILMIQTNPHLKTLVKTAVERSIQDWIHPVVDRSIKYALTTCEQIVKKDFALDPDEVRMRTSAHHLMRNLTAGMAMITCREQLLNTISANVKSALLLQATASTAQQKEIIEAAAAMIAAENMELACTIIQKTAVEKALPELDKRLANEIEERKTARQENRRFYNQAILNYQNERMPEKLRLKAGAPTELQLIVYEEFGRNIPGFAPVKERDAALMPKPVTQENMQLNPFNHTMNTPSVNYYGPDELSQLISDTEQLTQSLMAIPTLNILVSNLHSLLECLIVIKRSSEMSVAVPLIQKAIEGLAIPPLQDHLELFSRYKEVHIRTIKLLQDNRVCGHVWTIKNVVRSLNECTDDYKYNLHLIDCLMRNNLIHIPTYDTLLAQNLHNENNFLVLEFVCRLVQLVMTDESLPVGESDLPNTIDSLRRLSTHSRYQGHEGISSAMELLQSNQDSNHMLTDRHQFPPLHFIHSGISQARYREEDTSGGLIDKTEFLLREWIQIYHNPSPNSDPLKTFNVFVQQMNAHGILKTDDLITRFFKICTQICVDNVYSILEEERMNPPETIVRNKYYHMIDAYVRLVALLIKNSGEVGNVSPKINLLNKVLGLTAGRLLQDHDDRNTAFQHLPYIRIFIMLFMDLTQPEGVLESISHQLLAAFCHVFHMIRPSVTPGFCFAWIDFISHRAFLSRILASTPQQKGWDMYSQLLVDLFEFMGPFLKNTELSKPSAMAYKGILKLLLVLLHDFPEFLCDFHYIFCDEIPPNCIQLRNLILSAFPRNMRLPDPFTPNLKVDLLMEISLAPRVVTSYNTIFPTQFKKDLDSYLAARAPVTFLSELRSAVEISNESGKKYNIKLMNAVVLYVGTKAIQHIRNKSQLPNTTTIAHSAHMDIFQNLAVDLDHEGRYIFLNSIANQLRYPNCHTHYFSCALLYLFAEANTEAIQEQITRMLLERLIVNRPHPWGLLITFIELIKNPTYKFWEHDFVHCAPEIEKLFESIARSCLVEKTSVKQELEVND